MTNGHLLLFSLGQPHSFLPLEGLLLLLQSHLVSLRDLGENKSNI